ncbi:hypothetical protein P154DRAFT_569043 [Amniculicola lignicola CBS 123094]|uniref:Uncharacterized protein n=1 Tax=Amniculicola lignicola CBS 123094 TaxID=1392246 RepID=A0A6A5X5K2_9PLEO|nr:hypothetical protein P154DRAFT_569043 [Amniculicola lignicola CBS 123094]
MQSSKRYGTLRITFAASEERERAWGQRRAHLAARRAYLGCRKYANAADLEQLLARCSSSDEQQDSVAPRQARHASGGRCEPVISTSLSLITNNRLLTPFQNSQRAGQPRPKSSSEGTGTAQVTPMPRNCPLFCMKMAHGFRHLLPPLQEGR